MPRCSLICVGPEDHAGHARQQGDVARCDPWKGLRALVLGDDPHGCDLLVRCLEGMGMRTCVADGDEAALKILKQAGTDRVLLDAACRL